MNVNRTRLLVAAVALSLTALSHAQTKGDGAEFFGGAKVPASIAEKIDTSSLSDPQPVNRVIVYFDSGDARNVDAVSLAETLEVTSRRVGKNLTYVRTLATGGVLVEIAGNAVALEKKGGDTGGVGVDDATVLSVMEAFAADEGVTSVEPDAWMYPMAVPNDTSYSQMWHLRSSTVGINAEPAWDKATGTGVIVAVLDTGITSHPDLNANVVAGWDFISSATTARDGNGRDSNPADQGNWVATANECFSGSGTSNSSWHGTHVAGTIGAVTNNSTGIAGVAYNARVMPVRVLGKCGGSTSDIADAIVWSSGGAASGATTLAVASRAKVINMSLGGGGACSTTSQNAINTAVANGATVVVAAGNSAANASGFNPASCANVVTVAATNHLGGRANYSNFGTVVDLAAPGGQTSSGTTNGVLSTLNAGTTTPGASNYAWYQGTSMATPHVAGIAALALSRCSRTPSQLEALLKGAVRSFPQTCTSCGTGLLDANLAVNAAIAACGGGGGGTAPSFFENTADFTINDNTTVESPITVSGRTGNAPSALTVNVRILHTYIGDLKVDLVTSTGTVVTLHNRSGGSADNIIRSYSVNASSVPANGTWRLRVNDNAGGDTGRIDSWSLQF